MYRPAMQLNSKTCYQIFQVSATVPISYVLSLNRLFDQWPSACKNKTVQFFCLTWYSAL